MISKCFPQAVSKVAASTITSLNVRAFGNARLRSESKGEIITGMWININRSFVDSSNIIMTMKSRRASLPYGEEEYIRNFCKEI
jgi:hypothetical protein